MDTETVQNAITSALSNGHVTVSYVDVASIVGEVLTFIFFTAIAYVVYRLIKADQQTDS